MHLNNFSSKRKLLLILISAIRAVGDVGNTTPLGADDYTLVLILKFNQSLKMCSLFERDKRTCFVLILSLPVGFMVGRMSITCQLSSFDLSHLR